MRSLFAGIVLVLGSSVVLWRACEGPLSVAALTGAIAVAAVFVVNAIALRLIPFTSKGSSESSAFAESIADIIRRHRTMLRAHGYWTGAVFYLVSAPLFELGPATIPIVFVGMIALLNLISISRNFSTRRTERVLTAWIGSYLGLVWLASWIHFVAPAWLDKAFLRLR